MSSETPIRSLSPIKTSPARRAALSWRAREADRLARGPLAGRGHALKARQTPFSADKRGIHHHGVKTSTQEHCVPGAEAPAVPDKLQRLGEKQRPADGAKTPGTEDEEPLFGCTCVKTPSDHTDNPQRPTRAGGATPATASPPLPASRAGWGFLPRPVTPPEACWRTVYIPLSRLRDACRRCRPLCPGPASSAQWCGSWRLDGLRLSLDESHSMLPTH